MDSFDVAASKQDYMITIDYAKIHVPVAGNLNISPFILLNSTTPIYKFGFLNFFLEMAPDEYSRYAHTLSHMPANLWFRRVVVNVL